MDNYSIRDLETYSGIKAHTIRIWEKRYHLFQPNRTESNIRFYTNDELIKILNVATLLHQGWKISRICKLSEPELNKISERCQLDEVNTEYESKINGLVTAILGFDEARFVTIIDQCLALLGFTELIKQVIYPFLKRVGLMWMTEELCPSQEHFGSNIIRQKILTAFDALPVPVNQSKPPYLLFLPEGEYHELGLLVCNYMLRAKQLSTIYLGANTPLASVQKTHHYHPVSGLITFLVAKRQTQSLQDYIDQLYSTFPNTPIWLVMAHQNHSQLRLAKNMHLMHSIEDMDQLSSNSNKAS